MNYSPYYYPFQLAFLLLNIESTINVDSPDGKKRFE